MYRFFSIITFILFFFITGLQAQGYHISVQEIGIEDGLSSYNIYSIAQDHRGVIWVGTDYGINSYDGQKINAYTREENGLFSNRVEAISVDANNHLWIYGFDNNGKPCHSIFNPISEKVCSIKEYLGVPLPFEQYDLCFVAFKEHYTIFSAYDPLNNRHLSWEYDGEVFEPILNSLDISQSHPKHKIDVHTARLSENRYAKLLRPLDLRVDHSVVIIVDKSGKLIRTVEALPYPLSIDGDFIFSEDEQSYAYYCYELGEEQKYAIDSQPTINYRSKELNLDKSVRRYIHLAFFGKTEQENLVIETHSDNYYSLMLGTYSKDKFLKVDVDSMRFYNKAGKLIQQVKMPINLKLSNSRLILDRDDNIWISDNKSLYCITIEEKFLKRELDALQPPFKARGIYEGKNRILYAGSINTLMEKKNNQWLNREQFGVAGYHNTLSLLEEKPYLWVGLEEGHLLRYDLSSWKIDTMFSALNYKMLWSIHRTKDGMLWLGTGSGLYYLNEITNEIKPLDLSLNSSLGKSIVWAIHENDAGIWVSTSNGLYHLTHEGKEVLAHYSNKNIGQDYIPGLEIAHLHEDNNGIFWLATKGQGLIKWNPKNKKYKQYTQKGAGLSHNILYSVYEDSYDNLWISSQRGLMCFNKSSGHVQIFLEEDGLPHNEFNTISHHQGKDGRLYFGGQNGFLQFHPDDLQQGAINPPLIITKYTKQQLNKDTTLNLTPTLLSDHKIVLKPSDKQFELEFALLDYRAPENHQYSYQIKGYDQNWNYMKEGLIKISVLPYGSYQLLLRAKAANSNQWQNYKEVILIHVLRPFYLQWWFMVGVLISLGLLIYIAVQWRINSLKQRQVELEKTVEERTLELKKDKELIEEQAEELKALDKVKSNFFANISHELRTPLTLILGPLSYIIDNLATWEKEKVEELLLTMERNSKSLMDLIEEILDLSKLEANKLELEEEATPVKAFFERIFVIFQPQFEAEGIESKLLFDLGKEELNVLMDRKKIEKVLNNFLSNAIKFTPKYGLITLLVQSSNQQLKIQVIDTGRGVHPSDLPYIFDRFYQSKQMDQKLYGGTGIGLALVREFAQLMGGRVSADSILAKGSTFNFEFPLQEIFFEEITFEEPINFVEYETLIDIDEAFTILVVEDNNDMRDFVCRLLNEKYKVLSTKNGAEGLALIETQHATIDLIVSDVMMPEVDGFTLLQKVKSNTIWQRIPVIMLTALAGERDKLKALTIGVDDYLTKPFSVTELMVRVQNILYNYHQRRLLRASLKIDTTAEEKNSTPIITQNNQIDDKQWIENLEAWIIESLENKVPSVDDIADSVYLSSRQLSRKVKLLTGLSPAKFVKEIQLQMARKQLEDGLVLSVSGLAYDCGFNLPSTFSKLFKKRFGKLPSEYIK